MVQDIIRESGLPRALVARLAEVNEATVWSWLRPPKPGGASRAPRPESVQRLASGLKDYAGKLAVLADRLEAEVGS